MAMQSLREMVMEDGDWHLFEDYRRYYQDLFDIFVRQYMRGGMPTAERYWEVINDLWHELSQETNQRIHDTHTHETGDYDPFRPSTPDPTYGQSTDYNKPTRSIDARILIPSCACMLHEHTSSQVHYVPAIC